MSSERLSVKKGGLKSAVWWTGQSRRRRAYAGQGSASTSDLSPAAISTTIEAARAIAPHTGADECAGRAEAEEQKLAEKVAEMKSFISVTVVC